MFKGFVHGFVWALLGILGTIALVYTPAAPAACLMIIFVLALLV